MKYALLWDFCHLMESQTFEVILKLDLRRNDTLKAIIQHHLSCLQPNRYEQYFVFVTLAYALSISGLFA